MKYVGMIMTICIIVAIVALSESFQFYKSSDRKRRNLCIGLLFMFIAFDAYMWCENYSSIHGH